MRVRIITLKGRTVITFGESIVLDEEERINSMEMMGQSHSNTHKERNPEQILTSEEQKRKEWISQQKEIISTYENLRSRTNKVPSIEELAQESGFSKSVIQKHIAEIDIDSLVEPAKLSLPAIIDRIAYQASCGSLDAAKLYFQLIYEWKEQPMRAVKETRAPKEERGWKKRSPK